MLRQSTNQFLPKPIILYDGVCGLCNRFNQFVLKHDKEDVFRFASLQSSLARTILSRYQADCVESLCVVLDHAHKSERLLRKSDAVLYILRRLRGVSRILSVLIVFPRAIRDRGYDLIAQHRYRIFGRHDACPLPDEWNRSKFLDV